MYQSIDFVDWASGSRLLVAWLERARGERGRRRSSRRDTGWATPQA